MHYVTREMAPTTNVRDQNKNKMSKLYRAACRGDQQTLAQLLQQDATILSNIPDGRQTPLHISALLGHAGVTEVLLNHDHDLAIREDSSGRTALHLASAEGHIDVVTKLLQVNNVPCLTRDYQGRTPLHYAAMRGRTEIVQELIIAEPGSLSPLHNGKTVFHLCVTYNHLDTLETLVKLDYATANIFPTVSDATADIFPAVSDKPCRSLIFTLPDQAGDTILHLAIMFKRVEAVRYLLSIPEIRELENKKNKEDITAHDILERSPKDWKINEIKLMLTKDNIEEPKSMLKCIGNCFMTSFKWIMKRLQHDGSTNDWLEVMRGNLSAASIFIATVTFQALVNPPADLFQQKSLSGSTNYSPSPSQYDTVESPSQYETFIYHDPDEEYVKYITLCFYASLSVTVLLVSGVPLKNNFTIWILSMGMFLTILFLSSAYANAAEVMARKHNSSLSDGRSRVFNIAFTYVFLGLIGGFYTLRFIIWIAKKCYWIIKKLISCRRR